MPKHMTEPPESVRATPAETRAELLKKSGSGYTIVRKIFRQHPDDVEDRVSVLGPMVTDRKKRAVQLYLLLLTVWPWLQKEDQPLANATWARALTTDTGRHWTATNISEAWSDLEERGLVTRVRGAQSVTVTPRREDGAAEYTRPGGKKSDHRESYFSLPPSFWTDEWFERLSLPALAMLLIVAGETTENDEVWLTIKHAATWYGLSPKSVQNGLHELEEQGLLEARPEWVKSALSPTGAKQKTFYRLTGAFSTAARRKLQKRASAERAKRLGPSGGKKAASGATKKTATKKKVAKKRPTKSSGRQATKRGKEESA